MFDSGSGEANTILIVESIGGDPLYAPQQCLDYTTGSFNDWFLPSHDELYEMFLHRDSIGGFQAALYWSSTDDTASNAWAMEAESVLSGHSDVGRVKYRFLVKYDIQDGRIFVAWAGCIRNDRVTRGLSFVNSALVKPDLSSLDELQEMYAQRDVLIGLQDAFDWISTVSDQFGRFERVFEYSG